MIATHLIAAAKRLAYKDGKEESGDLRISCFSELSEGNAPCDLGEVSEGDTLVYPEDELLGRGVKG